MLKACSGTRLIPNEVAGISRVEILDSQDRFNLPWDRFVRLKLVSDHLRRIIGSDRKVRILDVGGYDGALAMFVPQHALDTIDPATTGGSGKYIAADNLSYDVVVSIDTIEHVPYAERASFLAELARVTGQLCLINFPNAATMPAQSLVLSLTADKLVKEHVDLGLPEKGWVVRELESHKFSCQVIPNGSLALWVAQHTLSSLAPEAALKTSRYLNETHSEEPFSVPLYYLIIGTRNEP